MVMRHLKMMAESGRLVMHRASFLISVLYLEETEPGLQEVSRILDR